MNRLTRRMFLRGVGGSILAIPFLPSMMRTATAQSASVPLRYVQAFSRFGRPPQYWYPSDPTEMVARNVYAKRLADYSGPISYILGSQWDSIRNKVTLIRGLDAMAKDWDNHSLGFPSTASSTDGNGTDPPQNFRYSIDSVLDETPSFYPTTPKVRVLRLTPLRDGQATPGDGPKWSFSWRQKSDEDRTPIPPIENLDAAFNTIFGGQPVTTDDRPLRARKKLADLVLDDYKRVQNSPRLSMDDKRRLENYLGLVSDVQQRLLNDHTQCDQISLVSASDNAKLQTNAIDLAVAALACDATRIVSYVIAAWTYTSTDLASGLHDSAHGNPEINRTHNLWVADRMAELMTKMDQIEEANGKTLLDNSIVYYGNCAAQGNHGHCDAPVLVGGSAGGRLRTGEYIDYRQRPFVNLPNEYTVNDPSLKAGRPYNDLLVTFFKAFGLQPQQWQRLGQTSGFGEYTIRQHSTRGVELGNIYAEYLDGDRNTGLPYYLT